MSILTLDEIKALFQDGLIPDGTDFENLIDTLGIAWIYSPFTYYFVDGINGSDSNDGLLPSKAKKTIQAAFSQAVNDGVDYPIINLFPSLYTETIAEGSKQFRRIRFQGLGHAGSENANNFNVIEWKAPAGGGNPILTLFSPGDLKNIQFNSTSGQSSGTHMVKMQQAFSIINCKFLCDDTPTECISTQVGGGADLLISGNLFFNNGAGTVTGALPQALWQNSKIENNSFYNFAYVFYSFTGLFPVEILNNRFVNNVESIHSAGKLIVCNNYFSAPYSIAGGYVPNASDEWIGNYVETGLTTAKPV